MAMDGDYVGQFVTWLSQPDPNKLTPCANKCGHSLHPANNSRRVEDIGTVCMPCYAKLRPNGL